NLFSCNTPASHYICPLPLHDALPIYIDIPSNAPDRLVIRLQANTIHYHLGYADHAEMRGSTATVRVNTEATPYRAEVTAVSATQDRKSTRLNSSHVKNSYAVFCLKKK